MQEVNGWGREEGLVFTPLALGGAREHMDNRVLSEDSQVEINIK
jgi:hypothetical protein